MLNKKADERILSFYWIFIFIIIGVGIVSATLIFYSSPLDIREVEAKVLSDKIIGCIVQDGKLNEKTANLLQNDGNNLEPLCGLNFKDSYADYEGKNQFYVEVKLEGNEIIFNKDNSGEFKALCSQPTRNYPICYGEKFFVLNNKGEFTTIEILTIVGKIKQNVQ